MENVQMMFWKGMGENQKHFISKHRMYTVLQV